MEKKAQKRKDRRVEMSVEGLKEDFAWHLRYSLAKGDTRATERDEYTAFAMAVRDRLVERWISTQEEYARQNEARLLHVARVPHRASSRQQRHQPQGRPALPRSPQGIRHRLEQPKGLRVRRRPRQRRPRASRRVLHRLDVDAEPRRHGLRPQVRLRHFPPEDRERLPGRGTGPLAQERLSVGDGASRVLAARPLRRPCRVPRRGRPPAVVLGAGRDGAGHSLRPSHRRLRQGRQLAAPLEREGGRRLRSRRLRQGLLRRGGRAEGARREPHQGALPERQHVAGQGAPPPPAVLLRRVLAPRHPEALPPDE